MRPSQRLSALTGRMGRLPFSRWSLRFRLSAFFTMLAFIAWLAAAFFAWRSTVEYVDEFFDTQQLLMAKTLAISDFGALNGYLPETKKMLPGVDKSARGEEEDDALRFAIYEPNGTLLLGSRKHGKEFIFQAGARGFTTARMYDDSDPWRVLWMPSVDGSFIVAVGQEFEYRQEIVEDMLISQIWPWLLALPVVLIGLIWMLTRELAPLNAVGRNLETRTPRDTTPIETSELPSEVRPLVVALNQLFARVGLMLARERAFVGDAAHELRTPLAGLRVQAEVIGLCDDDAAARRDGLNKLLGGIDRAARLAEQLLALSRLENLIDAGNATEDVNNTTLSSGQVDWRQTVTDVLDNYADALLGNEQSLTLRLPDTSVTMNGYPTLISLLVRNLLDNAVKYTPTGGEICVDLDDTRLRVSNSGSGVPDECVARLSERFFRPPGQVQPGSGLGLAIVTRIAEIHNFTVTFGNGSDETGVENRGFYVEILFAGNV